MSNNIRDVHYLINKGKVSDLWCPMLAKNHCEVIIDDGKLDKNRSYYLIASLGWLLSRSTWHLYMLSIIALTKFSRQFGLYEDAVYYRKRLLLFGSMSQGILPNYILTLLQYVTLTYRGWWPKMTINDLETNSKRAWKSTPSKRMMKRLAL